jgi:hypothetical protein
MKTLPRSKQRVSIPLAEESAQSLRPELLAYAKGRSQDVVRRIKKAMKAIESDIETNEGLYPFNGGRVSQAEVCRRAGVRNVTLQGKVHKAGTKLEVDRFVTRIRSSSISGSKSVRRVITDRTNNWKELHRRIAEAYHIDAMRYEKAFTRIRELEEENSQLRIELASLSGRNIVPIERQRK